MFAKAGEKLTRRIRRMMFEAMMRQEIGWFDLKENSVGALCTKLSSEAANIQGVSGVFTSLLIQQCCVVGFWTMYWNTLEFSRYFCDFLLLSLADRLEDSSRRAFVLTFNTSFCLL